MKRNKTHKLNGADLRRITAVGLPAFAQLMKDETAERAFSPILEGKEVNQSEVASATLYMINSKRELVAEFITGTTGKPMQEVMQQPISRTIQDFAQGISVIAAALACIMKKTKPRPGMVQSIKNIFKKG